MKDSDSLGASFELAKKVISYI
jgi:hypothetical protein